MLVNKDMKAALVRTSDAYIQKTVHYLRYRIEAHHNLLSQLWPIGHNEEDCSIYDCTSVARIYNDNVASMKNLINSKGLFTSVSRDRGLMNVFSEVLATPSQECDLLNARKVGEESYINHVKYNILHQPSTEHAPLRKHRLSTMAETKTSGKKKVFHSRERKEDS